MIHNLTSSLPNKHLLSPGENIDGWLVDCFLGEGGFSQVYRVYPHDLSKRYALKIVAEQQADLLKAEANILDKLSETQVPRPIKLGSFTKEGVIWHYLLMEYLPYNLKDFQPDSPKEAICWTQVIPITLKILKILQYAHAQAIHHRDLKPGNIGLMPPPGGITGRKFGEFIPYLLDFNIASNIPQKVLQKLQPSSELDNTALTEVIKIGGVEKSLRGGTEGYASPEQLKIAVEGCVHRVDSRTDIYSLGVVIYKLLTGYLPRGSYKKVSQLVSAPKWIDDILEKALAPSPDDRPQSALAMALDIERHMTAPVVAVRKYNILQNIYQSICQGVAFLKNLVKKLTKSCFTITTVLLILGLLIWIKSGWTAADNQVLEQIKKQCQGTLVYKNYRSINYLKGSDVLKSPIPLVEIDCPFPVERMVCSETNKIIWVGRDERDEHLPLDQRYGGFIFETNLLTRTSTLLLDTASINSELTSWGPPGILNIRAANKRIFFQLSSKGHRWYSLETNQPSSPVLVGVVTAANEFSDVSPDGCLRVTATTIGNLRLEYASDLGGSYYLKLKGSDPIWIGDD